MLTRQDANALKPVVRFTSVIEDIEGYLEAGMMARITKVTEPDTDGVFQVFYDLSEFDEYNRQFEKANYYDSNMVPCLTAREKGYYKPQDDYYTEATEVDGAPYWLTQFEVVPQHGTYLMDRFNERANKNQSYIQWLEQTALSLMVVVDLHNLAKEIVNSDMSLKEFADRVRSNLC